MGRPKGTTIKKKVVHKEEYDLFLKRLQGDESISESRRAYTRKAVCLLFYGGFRINEITTLTCGDIINAINVGEINLSNNTKTKRSRDVFFSPRAIEEFLNVFRDDIEADEGDLLFHGRGGRYSKVSVPSFTAQINELLHKYLGQGYGTHSFRHGYVTDLVREFGLRTAQVTIGHVNPTTTMRYVEVTEAEIAAAVHTVR